MLTPGDFSAFKRACATHTAMLADDSIDPTPLIDTAESLLDWCKHCSSDARQPHWNDYRLHFLRDTMPKVVTALAQRDYNDKLSQPIAANRFFKSVLSFIATEMVSLPAGLRVQQVLVVILSINY